MIEAGKFLTIALAIIAGLLAFGYLCLANVLFGVLWAVVGCILIAGHIWLDVESKP